VTGPWQRLALALELLAAEGPASVGRRLLDRRAARRRQRDFAPLAGEVPPAFQTPVLHVSAHSPDPWRGGVETQLLARLEAEARYGPVALLHPQSHGHRLELFGPGGRFALDRPAIEPHRPGHEDGDPALSAALRWALVKVGARLLAVEGLAGQSAPSLLAALEPGGIDLLLCLHDYAFACPWPALVDAATGEACRLCRDSGECAARTGRPRAEVDARRRGARALVAASRLLVVPSDSLRAGVERLAPGGPVEVVAPSLALEAVPPRRRPPARRKVAFLGGGQAHKGALLFEQLVSSMGAQPIEWHVYGGGDRATLRRLARLPGVRVRGYYRTGTLARRLTTEGIDLALLLSPWPESYLMTLDECFAAGVPVVLFDHGAPAERVCAEVGVRVPPAAGMFGVRAVLERWLAGGPPEPFPPRAVPTPDDGAARFRQIYERLGASSA
jgi:glycosyltransferase involved in cell wall biosynthesis